MVQELGVCMTCCIHELHTSDSTVARELVAPVMTSWQKEESKVWDRGKAMKDLREGEPVGGISGREKGGSSLDPREFGTFRKDGTSGEAGDVTADWHCGVLPCVPLLLFPLGTSSPIPIHLDRVDSPAQLLCTRRLLQLMHLHLSGSESAAMGELAGSMGS